ncbi:hypothetical protein [Rhodomicrobium lacus]|uniref:hypothetical protein n=1 Tax=Rhodomicrobium lacus TaxID=2498452 RepID=UPI001FE043E9|nr:hypothetical protein [Rhodomicrobium lacus]
MSNRLSYHDFLRAKIPFAGQSEGAETIPFAPHPSLKPHQAAAARWMIDGGRRALFAAFGLGKTRVQLSVVDAIARATGTRGLIVIPLGVRQEFLRDAADMGICVRFIRSVDEAGPTGVYLTNYETVRDGKIDPTQFPWSRSTRRVACAALAARRPSASSCGCSTP